MFKKSLKFIGIVFIYIVLNSISFSLLPFSAEFKAQNMEGGPSSLPFVLISTCWIVFTIVYIINNCEVKGIRLTISTILIIFFVSTALTQLETLFFGDAFKGLIKKDILMICLANLIPVLLSVITAVLLFKRKDNVKESDYGAGFSIDMRKSIKVVLVIGAVYTIVYFSFGYFVAWRFEAVRLFYSGSAVDSNFIDKLISNWNDTPIIYPFQYFRGLLFACCGLGLLSMK